MLTDELDFDLPPELIAQHPPEVRGMSRLLHYQQDAERLTHRAFSDFATMVGKADLLVFNNAKVMPARFDLEKPTGGRVEGLFVEQLADNRWRVMLKRAGSYRGELAFSRAPEVKAQVLRALGEGEYELEVSTTEDAATFLEKVGRMPLPPYIRRGANSSEHENADRKRYQTVYAQRAGSVAAPTAGLHFTDELLAAIDATGAQRASVTLHVGLGTFKPVATADLADHRMHTEKYEITDQAAEKLNRAQVDGLRIIAIGTTSARVLESHDQGAPWKAGTGSTSIFITPGYRWKYVRALLTNFHLPRSTLIALVSALIGMEQRQRIYAEAIAARYRFFSYGDAMFAE